MAILRKKKQLLNEEEVHIQCEVAEISEDDFNNLFDAAMTLKTSKQRSDEGEWMDSTADLKRIYPDTLRYLCEMYYNEERKSAGAFTPLENHQIQYKFFTELMDSETKEKLQKSSTSRNTFFSNLASNGLASQIVLMENAEQISYWVSLMNERTQEFFNEHVATKEYPMTNSNKSIELMLKASVKNDEITAQICCDFYNKRKSIMNLRAALKDVVKGKCSDQPVRKEDKENEKIRSKYSFLEGVVRDSTEVPAGSCVFAITKMQMHPMFAQ
ncbi:unnamed protein product [Caenorhabditis nigoni]